MNAKQTLQTKEVAETLGLHERAGHRVIIRAAGVLAAIASVVVVLGVLRGQREAAAAPNYATETVTRGKLVETVSATGTLACSAT